MSNPIPTLQPITDERPYGWTGFEPEPDGTGDGSGDPEKMIGIIGLWSGADGALEDEIAVIVHRTCGGKYPLDGAFAQQKELIALHIVNLLNDNPIDFDAIIDGIDFDRATAASIASHQES